MSELVCLAELKKGQSKSIKSEFLLNICNNNIS